MSPVSSGNGDSSSRLGQLNQRSAMERSSIGVQTLATTIAPSSIQPSQRACLRDQACSSPSVFRISQVAPSNA